MDKNEKTKEIEREEYFIKLKKQLGITLVALVVTIIILLIISGIVISQLVNNGLLDKAKLAKGKYENSVILENDILTNYGKNYEIDEVASTRAEVSAPVGTIISYMGVAEHKPNGYVVCDGSKYPITGDYAALANHIETNFGSKYYFGGNESEGFAVPDLRGEFLRGSGTNSHEDGGNGSNVGIHQGGTVMDIMTKNGCTNDFTNSDKHIQKSYSEVFISAGKGNRSDGAEMARPTNTSVLYCIKY